MPLNGNAHNSYAPFLLDHVFIWGLMETLQHFAPLTRPVVSFVMCTNLPQVYLARQSLTLCESNLQLVNMDYSVSYTGDSKECAICSKQS